MLNALKRDNSDGKHDQHTHVQTERFTVSTNQTAHLSVGFERRRNELLHNELGKTTRKSNLSYRIEAV